MAFFTRPHFEDRQIVQHNDESITLSGLTYYSPSAQIIVQPSSLNNLSDDGNGVFSGLTSGSTTISTLTGELISSRISGIVVQPPILNLLDLSGNTTGTTTVDVTGYVLKAYDSGGTVVWGTVDSLSADTNTFLSGSSVDCGTNIFSMTMNNGDTHTTDLSCLTFSGGSGTCITDLYVTNIHGCSPITIHNSIQSNTSSVSATTNSLALGYNNTVKSDKSSILGGGGNYIQGFGGANGRYSIIGGGRNNYTYGISTSIVGGESNYNYSYYGFIGGGRNNYTIGGNSVIGGGRNNTISTNDNCFIGGGWSNVIGNGVGDGCVIVGGRNNTMISPAGGKSYYSSILGGRNNKIIASGGYYNTIIGGTNNVVSGVTDTHIIGSNITATTSNTTYVNKLKFSDSGSTFISDINSNLDIGVTNDPINGDLFKIYFGTSYFGIRNTGSTNSVESLFLGNDTLGDIVEVNNSGMTTTSLHVNGTILGNSNRVLSDVLPTDTATIELDTYPLSDGTYKTLQAGNTNITLNATTAEDLTYSTKWSLEFTQDATTGRTLTLGVGFLTPGGTTPEVSSTTGATDTLYFETDSNGKHRLIEHRQNYL